MVAFNPMEESILESVKRNCGYESDSEYDKPLITEINTVFVDLFSRCGIVDSVFQITGSDEKWSDFTNNPELFSIPTYMWMKVKMRFDAESLQSAVSKSYEEFCSQIEFQVMTATERYV